MKRFFALLLALFLTAPLFPAVPAVRARAAVDYDPEATINVYSWGEYIANGTDGSLDINAEFTKRTGIKVNYTTFDSNESLYSKLVGGGGPSKGPEAVDTGLTLLCPRTIWYRGS